MKTALLASAFVFVLAAGPAMAEELTAPDSETTVQAAAVPPVLPEGATQDTEDLYSKPAAVESNAYGGCIHHRSKQEQTVYYTN